MLLSENILIIDFGSQFTQLIIRRIREASVFSEIFPHTITVQKVKEINPKGIILSGGPMSVYDLNAPQFDTEILHLGIPLLGICYGHMLICREFNAAVEPAENREYGKAVLEIKNNTGLFKGVKNRSSVWMSHGDYISSKPDGFMITAVSDNSPFCAISDNKNLFGVQFHPEVAHTEEGKKIISNFLFEICKCKGDWTPNNFIESKIAEIRKTVGSSNVICALSGGVDSTVAAVLVKQAVGNHLTCIHIDSGLMRKNESRLVSRMFENKLNLNFISIDASKQFLQNLLGISDPEEKRKVIGKTFIDVFETEAAKIKDADFLVQGTLYPDVIESISLTGASVTIKSHHNVGGLPENMKFTLIEPFRELFKDEVRNVGRELNIPVEFLGRHPFPGPGLAVRIIGEINEERLDILREADDIFIQEIKLAGLYDKIWQAFAVLLSVRSVGVMGDSRTYENVLALRAVTSVDGMTADWFRFDQDFLANVSNKISNKVRGINRVVYDISSKPPSTIEWE